MAATWTMRRPSWSVNAKRCSFDLLERSIHDWETQALRLSVVHFTIYGVLLPKGGQDSTLGPDCLGLRCQQVKFSVAGDGRHNSSLTSHVDGLCDTWILLDYGVPLRIQTVSSSVLESVIILKWRRGTLLQPEMEENGNREGQKLEEEIEWTLSFPSRTIRRLRVWYSRAGGADNTGEKIKFKCWRSKLAETNHK